MLDVSDSCKADRLTRNGVPTCAVEVFVISTAKGCADDVIVPKVLEFHLNASKVDPNSEVLNLTYHNDTIQVETGR